MKFEPKKLEDGSLHIAVTLTSDEVKSFQKSDESKNLLAWGKTDYCVSCKNGKRYTIETYGDIAANFEAALTCLRETGDPSFGLSKGSC